MKPIISVRNLSKRFTIGARQEAYTTFREAVSAAARTPFRRRQTGAQAEEDLNVWALRDVNFEVMPGEVVGIIGHNGAGKSTLLKVLSRITEPTMGEIDLYGRVGSLLEVGTGFNPELTGRENIYLNGAILGMHRKEISQKFDEIVDFAEIDKYLDTPVKRYSSGMYMRLAFAVAAHLDPEILVVDEVLAVGDSMFQKKCLGKMGAVAQAGRTVLFVSHNMSVVENLCTRGLVLDRGSIVCSDDIQPAIRTYLKKVAGSAQTSFLHEKSRRSGDGKVRFTDFHVEGPEGNRTGIVRCGDNVSLVFSFACPNPQVVRDVAVGFGIHSLSGERLAIHYTYYTDQSFESIPTTGEFRCRLPHFALAPGRYVIVPRIEVRGTEADWPRDGIGFIDVEAGDFFGTGRTIGDRASAPFLIRGDWSMAEPSLV